MAKNRKKSNDWLIAILAVVIIAAVTVGGVLYLESLLEKNKAPSAQNEQITAPETEAGNEASVNDSSKEEVNQNNQEQAVSDDTAARQEENSQPAQEQSTPVLQQSTPASEPEQSQQGGQESGTSVQPDEGATPVPTDTPLGENELPDF